MDGPRGATAHGPMYTWTSIHGMDGPRGATAPTGGLLPDFTRHCLQGGYFLTPHAIVYRSCMAGESRKVTPLAARQLFSSVFVNIYIQIGLNCSEMLLPANSAWNFAALLTCA